MFPAWAVKVRGSTVALALLMDRFCVTVMIHSDVAESGDHIHKVNLFADGN